MRTCLPRRADEPHERALRIAGLVLLGLLLAGVGVWGVLALLYFEPLAPVLRTTFAAVFAAGSSHRPDCPCDATLAVAGRRLPTWGSSSWCWPAGRASPPPTRRNWRPEVAVLPYATFLGAQVTVHNIRNFDYRTETDFTPAYYDATFDACPAEFRGPDRRLLDGAADRPRHHELRLQRRTAPGLLDRGTQRARRGLLHPQGLLPAVRTATTWLPMSAMSSACAPTSATTRPRTPTCSAWSAPRRPCGTAS